MPNLMNQNDTISSKEGTVFVTVDGKNIPYYEIGRASCRERV